MFKECNGCVQWPACLMYIVSIRWDFRVSETAMMEVVEDLNGELAIPDNFSRTVPPYDPTKPQHYASPSCTTNPQTTELCAMVGLTDIYAQVGQGSDVLGKAQSRGEKEDDDNDRNSAESADEPSEYPTDTSQLSETFNPDEITIEDEWEEEEEGKVETESGSELKAPSGPVSEIHTPSRLVLPEPKSDALPSPLSFPMNLPPPSHSTPAPAQSQSGAVREEEGKDEDASVMRILKRTSDETEGPGSKSTTPRIKRRNQVIYQTVEDEESEN